MAAAVQVHGPTEVKIQRQSGVYSSLTSLGWTRNGVVTSLRKYREQVPGDQNGGDSGPPIEILHHGDSMMIRCELTKYDANVALALTQENNSGTVGQPSGPGRLMYSNLDDFRVVLTNGSSGFNFPRCVLAEEPVEVNRGTKFSTWIVVFQAYTNASGILWNTTVS